MAAYTFIDHTHDVVVVGAGLTGLTTAVMLARQGTPPLVIEARHVAAGTTGHSTAKLSVLQGAVYSGILRHGGRQVVRDYAAAQQAGQRWLLDFCDAAGVPVQRRDSWSYAVTPEGAERLAEETKACRTAGLPVETTTDTDLPFPVTSGLRLADQAQFDPVEVCLALRDELVSRGGSVVERIRVTGVSTAADWVTLRTSLGELRARRVVLATGMPVLDRGLDFAQLQPQRSYALGFHMPDGTHVPQGMYLSVDSPGRSLRTAPHDDGEWLLVGGNNHVVGRNASPAAQVADLVAWTDQHFPAAELRYSWAAQDYRSTSRLPMVDVLPRSGGRILAATGFDKWGMANATASALMLTADLRGSGAEREFPWARSLRRRSLSAADLVLGVEFNASVATRLARDWAVRVVPGGGAASPEEGQGRVERGSLRPTGVCTVAGQTHRVDAVCPHLGGILAWNDSDLTWDCPLHGSRFTADGHRIEGPALRDLETR